MDIVINLVITGIHRTKTGNNPGVQLIVESNDSISHKDPDCRVVEVSCLEDRPPSLHQAIAYRAGIEQVLGKLSNWL